jgi:predicted RNA binding protein YcfA (HicA-like mRNA interferase family)
LLQKLARGAFQNVAFSDAVSLVESFGFSLARVSGSHHVFVHPKTPEVVNLQEVGGEAKPYQLRQVLKLIERYNLKAEDKQ